MSANSRQAAGLRSGIVLLLALAGAASCTTDEYRRGAGITDEAGNAIAHNTALQLVDPWQEGVDDTDLLVPHDRGSQPTDDIKGADTTSE